MQLAEWNPEFLQNRVGTARRKDFRLEKIKKEARHEFRSQE